MVGNIHAVHARELRGINREDLQRAGPRELQVLQPRVHHGVLADEQHRTFKSAVVLSVFFAMTTEGVLPNAWALPDTGRTTPLSLHPRPATRR